MIAFKEGSALPAPSRNIIEHTEEYFEIQFPAEYIAFLQKNNGAIPITQEFLYNGHEYAIERFLCLLDDDLRDQLEDESWSEIRVVMTELDEFLVDDEDQTGMTIVPIAVLFAGDYVCLDYRENADKPQICIWSHEESDEFDPVTYKVADSFTDFLNMLH